MKLFTLTLCHSNITVLSHGLERYAATAVLPTEHVLVDHLYPINAWSNSARILGIANTQNLKLIRPYENRGLCGGWNWAIAQLPIEDSDFVIGYDPDANPVETGWDAAMVSALNTHRELGAVSLIFERIRNRTWQELAPGILVSDTYQFFDITMWRVSTLKAIGGLQASREFYGGFEETMFAVLKGHGYLHGFLKDYSEAPCPIPHDPEYHGWKMSHANGHPKAFKDYLKLSAR